MDHHHYHQHHQQPGHPPLPRGGRQVTGKDVAQANDYFEHFLNATSLKNILGYYRSICDLLNLKPNLFPLFYPKLRGYLTSWRAKALWKKFDARAAHKCYGKGKLCGGSRVLIIGAGPCGLRTAIEAQLLGAKVVVIEKRDRLSRNNVLHLWPFVIEDLRGLGAKKFFGKFCAGAIDHISIRQLQCILLKVVLLLGVEVHTEVSFERLVEPDLVEKTGWRAEFKPSTHPVSQYEFDVVIGADGKRNTLQGFKRKEFRGKLAIAITANFINKRTEAEARVEEISGVAFIFNQKFFKELYEATGIDLENIVYYKDDTHYFVMTAKKPSLIEKGVIKQDLADTERLLAPDNVNREALMDYAREAANFSTNYQMPDLEFAVNHYGQPDVAMFDFTSMYAAENASKVVERDGYRLLMILVGDSLLEPFWPTGSGCARGFLSSLDAAWAIRSWCSGTMNPLDVIAERESIYRLLGQTTPDNLNKDWKAYTLDPATRYPNLNKNVVLPHQTSGLFDTDNPKSIERMRRHSQDVVEVPKKRRRGNVDNEVLLNWISEQVREHEDIAVTDLASVFRDGKVLCAVLNHYRPDLLDYGAIKDEEPSKTNQIAMDVLEREIGISPIMTGEEITNTEDYLAMATYLTQVYDSFRCEIPHIKHPKLELPETKRSDTTFKSIRLQQQQPELQPLPAPPRPSSRHKRHADVLTVSKPSQLDRKMRKRRTLEKLGASVDHENKQPNQPRGANADEDFAARIKNLEDKWREPQPVEKKPKDLLRAIGKIETSDWNIKEIEKKIRENKLGKPASKDKEKVPKWSKEQFLARQTKMEKQHLDRQDSAEAKYADIDKSIKHLELKLKEGNARELGQNKVASITEKLVSKVPEPKPVQRSQSRPVILPGQNGSEFCHFCGKRVYLMERLSAEGRFFHHGCFKCQYCNTQLRLGSYAFDRDGIYDHKFFCIHHYGMQGELRAANNKVARKPSQRQQGGSPEKKALAGIAGVDLLDRVRTPERVEFANLSAANPSSDHEESLSQMDEDEWTDKNFGASAAEVGSSEDESSSLSDTDSDDEDAFEEALEEPATKEGTLKWAERFNRRYSKKRDDSESDAYSSSDQSSYYENTSDDDDSETATEGEEEIRARELRKQEVRVEPPLVHTDTGTDTEVVSDESTSDTSSSSEVRNSATEISTDSEFAHDDPTPTRELPFTVFDDSHVTKTRGSGHRGSGSAPRKIQVTSGYLQRPSDKGGRAPPPRTASPKKRDNIELNLTPLVPPSSAPSITVRSSALRPEGYALNRTQSTGGIAAKVSLELKKKYLLGESHGPGSIQKSGSASTLDDKLKSFHSNISDCQKLLRPAPEVSASMQTFCSKLMSPTTTMTATTTTTTTTTTVDVVNEPEGRPRSPVHETSIVVPEIDWSKTKPADSLSTDSVSDDEAAKRPDFNFDSIPTVRIEEIPPDSLCLEVEDINRSSTEPPKSINGERKTLNQPKPLPDLELPEVHEVLHVKRKSSAESDAEATAALTETELSDWARDGAVSDDLGDDDFELHLEQPRGGRGAKPAKIAELEDIDHVCGKEEVRDKTVITEALNSVLSKNLDIEFMDTGTETSSEDGVADSQNGYVLFKDDDDDDVAEDSLVNEVVEARNEVLAAKNTGYCIVVADNFGGEVVDLKPADVEELKLKNRQNEHEEDSLLVVADAAGTTTEENTCSDSTVKNLTEISVDKQQVDNNNFQRKRLEEKLAKLKAEQAAKQQQQQHQQKEVVSSQGDQENNVEFDEHCHRLRSKIEFGNVKDSIDVRKSRRKSKSSESPPKPDLLIQEAEEEKTTPTTPLLPVRTPDVLYKKEEIEKERDVNQKLVQEMVMNKMKAENKNLERKRRRSSRSFELSKSATTDVVSEMAMNNNSEHRHREEVEEQEEEEKSPNRANPSGSSSVYATPDVLLSTLKPSDKSSTTTSRPLSVHVTTRTPTPALRENPSLPDVRKALFASAEEFATPVAPPRLKHEAKARAQQLSNEQLGLSPEEKLTKLKEKLCANRRTDATKKAEKQESFLHSNEALNKKTEPSRTKSSGEIAASVKALDKFCRSDPNLLDITDPKKAKKSNSSHHGGAVGNNKDKERRKSIAKLFTTLFTKKSPSGNSRGLFSRISPKAKDVSKSCANLDLRDPDVVVEEPVVRRKSFSETSVRQRSADGSPPPIPPLPLNYSIRGTDDSSDGCCDHEWKRRGGGGGRGGAETRSSCDTLDQSAAFDTSLSSLSNNRVSKSARRIARQAQLKRHRMAQEIQRKLEETEVKTRELEERGVQVEKALRGEDDGGRYSKEESELLQEWFDLMRDRTELRRYERELMVRAQELELEDRHARLQHELRERLENNEQKTEEEVEIEGSIINEMMEIVAKRDSLIALLEEDRLRYSNEDRDFEEQMLAKGLRLTPIRKTPEK